MNKFYFGACILCTTLGLSAQEVLWQKDIQSSTQDFLSQVTTTIDQQYLITGSSIQSQKFSTEKKQNNGYDFHLVKLNQQGEQVWEKYFSGANHDYLSATVATQDGGFLVSGTSYSGKGLDKKEDSKGGSDIWLIRLNEFGDELWQKTLGTSSDEESRAVIQTTDLGFFVAGNRQSSLREPQATSGYGSKDVLIVKLDKNGKELSQSILGGKGLDEVEKMIPTKDGGALLGIYSRSNIGGSKKTENYGEGDYWIIKLDKTGKVEWEKNFGGKGDDHLRTLALTSTGYIIGGESRSERSGNKTVGIEEGTDLWLISLNERGEEIWQKSYNFKNRDILMGMSVIQSQDEREKNKDFTKGILLGGYTQAEGRIEAEDETFWMLYLNQDGNEQWRKHVTGDKRQREERLSDLKLNRDGSIILAGTSAQELGKENWKIVKLGDKQIDQLIEKQNMKIYPNPVSEYAYVEIGYDFKEADIVLYDMGGRQLQTVKTKNKVTKINTQNLIQGAYLVTIKTDTNKTANAKLIKK
ncbi:T9SS C-terminal target domain-containing protein [Chryseobacterium carnipullorum]|uniref:Por secretion system C-terminal sorting domain n=2 Tax=Chryseobacterium carnipullorum TaxID=1124835 RepID=A0A376E550_CHRCU|nr:T9SS type A sorting domain-containing protein [Chryseobacterium carnipullorum]AZA50881.1 T9SS C-terminal target domain-containing protein [Chryseobacterium carnipullorum]AZA65743.1 T9SS C-terminal target domain-containing protein [Chryseobacterium carnipullorum]STD02793.1 Por secretion system C-terminal sorting domain [Chryseobacterium carnipullorum]